MVWEGLKPLVFCCLQGEQKRGIDLKWDNELNVALNMIKVNTKDTKKNANAFSKILRLLFSVFVNNFKQF